MDLAKRLKKKSVQMDKKRRKIKELIENENKLKGDIVRKQEKYS